MDTGLFVPLLRADSDVLFKFAGWYPFRCLGRLNICSQNSCGSKMKGNVSWLKYFSLLQKKQMTQGGDSVVQISLVI